MIYVLSAMLILISACTVFYITPGSEQPVSIQTTDPINVLGSQNVTSADRATRGSAHGDLTTGQEATAVPIVPITAPIKFP